MEPLHDTASAHDAPAEKDLLRFVTVGSVDDGKSTLIGRLLHDAHGVYDDQLSAVRRASARRNLAADPASATAQGAAPAEEGDDAEIDFSLFTDGLRAEREQGITIDVAYRYFTTARRKFILADTPGHVQYTRNMVTGASTADVAIVLLDARLGVLPQSRRHAYLASLLGIAHLAVAVNKMDLVGYDPAVYARLRDDFAAFVAPLGFAAVTYFPISARRGDNVARASTRTPWYDGPTLLHFLETVPLPQRNAHGPLRFPVQLVLRPHLDYRGFAGSLAAGTVRPGDRVRVLPSGREARVASVDFNGASLPSASAPLSVTVRLDDHVDVARGDMLVDPAAPPRVTDRFVATLVWMHERPLDPARRYLLKHTTRTVPARVETLLGRRDLDTLALVPAEGLGLNDIGPAVLRCERPLFVDPYATHRESGAFILIDALTHDTVAAGMVADEAPPPVTADASGYRSRLTPEAEAARPVGALVWIDLPPHPQPAYALAAAVERALVSAGRACAVVERSGPEVAPSVAVAVEAGAVVVALVQGASLDHRVQTGWALGRTRVHTVESLPTDDAATEAAAGALVAWATTRTAEPTPQG
jgi:bifunctional enzyme CysN/CysC